MGGVDSSNWFIGKSYTGAGIGGIQKLVWVPPEPGQEKFVEADSAGWHKERDAIGEDESYLLDRAFRRIGTRISPFMVELRCNDYTDADLLLHWLVSSVKLVNAGALEHVHEAPVVSGGYVAVDAGQRGVLYQLNVQFAFPVVAPNMDLRLARSVILNPRFETGAHAVARQMLKDDNLEALQKQGIRVPTDVSVTPWRNTSDVDPNQLPIDTTDADTGDVIVGLPFVYWGTSVPPGTVNAAFVRGLANSDRQVSPARNLIHFVQGVGQRAYYCWDASFGDDSVWVLMDHQTGFEAALYVKFVVDVTDPDTGVVRPYYVAVSDNIGLADYFVDVILKANENVYGVLT